MAHTPFPTIGIRTILSSFPLDARTTFAKCTRSVKAAPWYLRSAPDRGNVFIPLVKSRKSPRTLNAGKRRPTSCCRTKHKLVKSHTRGHTTRMKIIYRASGAKTYLPEENSVVRERWPTLEPLNGFTTTRMSTRLSFRQQPTPNRGRAV